MNLPFPLRDSDHDGIPDIIDDVLPIGETTVIGTGESITTTDEAQGPRPRPAPGTVNFD